MNRSKSKFWSLLLIMVLIVAACGGSDEESPEASVEVENAEESTTNTTQAEVETGLSGEILIDGSSTVFPITQAVAEEFTIVNPDVNILSLIHI